MLTVNAAKNKVTRCSRNGGLEGAEIVFSGETQEQEVRFCYLNVDIATAGSTARG